MTIERITDNIQSTALKDYFDSIVNATDETEIKKLISEKNKKIKNLAGEKRDRYRKDYLSAIDTMLSNLDDVTEELHQAAIRKGYKDKAL